MLMKKNNKIIVILVSCFIILMIMLTMLLTGAFHIIRYYDRIKPAEVFSDVSMINYEIDFFAEENVSLIELSIPIYISGKSLAYQTRDILLTDLKGENLHLIKNDDYKLLLPSLAESQDDSMLANTRRVQNAEELISNENDYFIAEKLDENWTKYVANIGLFVQGEINNYILINELTFNFFVTLNTNSKRGYVMYKKSEFSIPVDIRINFTQNQTTKHRDNITPYIIQSEKHLDEAYKLNEEYPLSEKIANISANQEETLVLTQLNDTSAYCVTLLGLSYKKQEVDFSFNVYSFQKLYKLHNSQDEFSLPYSVDISREVLYLSYSKTLKQDKPTYVTYLNTVYAEVISDGVTEYKSIGNSYYYNDEEIVTFLIANS